MKLLFTNQTHGDADVGQPWGLRLIFSICIVLCCAFLSTAQSLKFVGSNPANGDRVSSLSSIELEFDLSDVISSYGEGDWGVCMNGFYVATVPKLEKSTTLYEGDETGTVIERLATIIKPNQASFQVGNKLSIKFKEFEIKPDQEYTLVIKHEFYAGKKGESTWEVGSKLSFQNNPIVLKFYGASQVAKVLTCESTSLGQNEKFEKLNESVKLSFNYDAEVLSEASAVITENNVSIATASSITVDPTDSKSVLISFPETTLYNGHKYTLDIPAGIIGISGETDIVNSEISIPFEGLSFRSFGIGRVSPANNSTSIIDNIIVPFKFPVIEGSNWSYGFVNVKDAKYPMRFYKGTEEDGELIATINGEPDNSSLEFAITCDRVPATLYTCVIDEGTVKAYAIGDPRESYLKDYISEKVVLTYTTPALSSLGSITLKGSDFTQETAEHVGTITFSDVDYVYNESTSYHIIDCDLSNRNSAGILYEVTPDGDKEVKRFRVALAQGYVVEAVVEADLYAGKVYKIVIPEGTFKVNGSNFLGRYVTSEEYSMTINGAKSTESASEFTSGIVEGQKLSHVGVVSFYTAGDVKATDNAKLEIRNGEETVASAPVRVAKEEGYTHVYADFSGEGHQPFATEKGVSYAAVLPQGAVAETANENLLNKEYSVPFTGMASDPVYHNVTLSIDNATAQTSTVEEGKTVSFMLTPVDDLWTVESVSNATLDEASGMYVTEPVKADVEVKAVMALAKPVDYDFMSGIEAPAGCPLKVSSEGDRLIIAGVEPGDNIRIYTVGGSLMANLGAVPEGSSIVSFSLAQGVYIIAVNNTTLKVKH